MDPLIDALASPPPTPGKSRLDAWAETLPPERLRAVLAAAKNPDWPHSHLIATLKEFGAPEVGGTTFRAWRTKKGLPRVS